MGELLQWHPPTADKGYYQELIQTLNELYPEDWKSWAVKDVSYDAIFGVTLTPQIEAHLRFAVPTLRLASIFGCDASLGERRYKAMKRKLLEWPIGRALIYQPQPLMAKVHCSGPQCKFEEMLSLLRPHLLSRKEADQILKAGAKEKNIPSKSTSKRLYVSKITHQPTYLAYLRSTLTPDST